MCPKASGNVLLLVLKYLFLATHAQHCADAPGASSDPGLHVTQSCE